MSWPVLARLFRRRAESSEISSPRPRFFYGWYMVAAAVIITLYTGGVVNFGFTAVFDPIAEQFHWSYAQISLASSLRGLEVGLLSAIVGMLVDKWGPRRLILGGSILVALGFVVLSRVSSLGMFYAAFALIALGMSACTGVVLLTAVSNWFDKRAGIATGIVASGFGLGGTIVPLVTALIDTLKWRNAMLIVGGGMLAICLPLALVMRTRPEPYGYYPDGAPAGTTPKPPATEPPAKETHAPVLRALRDRAFWHISLSSMCHAFVVGAVVTHIMPYLESLEIERSVASLVALVLPVCSIAGRLSSGWLSNRFGNKTMYSASFVFMTTGLAFFGYVTLGSFWLVVPFIIAFSLGWGFSVISRITLLREHYGRAIFGAVLGFNSTIMMIGNTTGAPIAGWVYDHWHSYQCAWLSFGALTLVGMILALTAPAAEEGRALAAETPAEPA